MWRYNYNTGAPVEGAPIGNAELPFEPGPPRFYQPPQMFQPPQGIPQPYPQYQPPQQQGYFVHSFFQPGMQGYNGGNPVYQVGQRPPYYRPPEKPQDKVVVVPGYNPSGSEGIFPSDLMERLNDLQEKMEIEQEEINQRRLARQQSFGYYPYGANYYNQNYFAFDTELYYKYRREAEKIKQEAMEKRLNLNKLLSRTAHAFIGDEIQEQDIEQIYNPRNEIIKAEDHTFLQKMNYLDTLREVSNVGAYQKHFQDLKEQYQVIFGENPSCQEFMDRHKYLHKVYDELESMKKRRDGTQYYQRNTYREVLRRERLRRDGVVMPETIQDHYNPADQIDQMRERLQQFGTLRNSAKLMDDATLTISAPAWIGTGEQIRMNEMERHFEENRNRFLQSIYNTGTNSYAAGSQ